MTEKIYEVTLETASGQTRIVTVPSPTDVQAGDAARPLMQQDEAILAINQLADAAGHDVDAGPPKTQAEELAPVTPGVASISTDNGEQNNG